MVVGNLLARRRILLLDHLPVVFRHLLTKDVVGCDHQHRRLHLGWTYLFGVLWGFGGLTFGLAMRYLGMSLGMGVALGYCAAFGTLLPPILKSFFPDIPVGESIGQIASTVPGQITLLGVFVCLVGIWIAALAGATKEKEMSAEDKSKSIKEFNFKKGILVATFSGIMSACFSFGLTAGEPIGKASSPPAPTPNSGPACPASSSSCSADSPPTSSGASCSTSAPAPVYEYLAGASRQPGWPTRWRLHP
jgi:hypothetical protein